jgi:ElaB/YqjD/DUF883 family membrane-anchored ribosome-binding protein
MQTTISDPGFTGAGSADKVAAGADRAAAGIERLSSTAHHAVDRAAETAATAAHQLADQGQRLVSTGDHLAEMTRDCVRHHPIASVGVAVGVGLLLSLLTRRPH